MLFKQKDENNVIVLGGVEHDTPAPEVGKVYKCFDDGKIRLSRLDYWRIDEAINLDNGELDAETLLDIAEEINNCYWLYSPEQHIIYKATMVNEDGSVYRYQAGDEPTVCYFLRTKNKEWFGCCSFWWDGLLDVDDYYFNKYIGEDE